MAMKQDGQGWAYGVPNMDQMVKVRIGNRKVMEMKQGSLETKMRQGGVMVRVPVRGCTECNIALQFPVTCYFVLVVGNFSYCFNFLALALVHFVI